jgi:hypothetical protein
MGSALTSDFASARLYSDVPVAGPPEGTSSGAPDEQWHIFPVAYAHASSFVDVSAPGIAVYTVMMRYVKAALLARDRGRYGLAPGCNVFSTNDTPAVCRARKVARCSWRVLITALELCYRY